KERKRKDGAEEVASGLLHSKETVHCNGLRYCVILRRILTAFAISAVCFAQSPAPTKINTDPTAYLNRVLDEIQHRALHSSNVDWTRVRAEAQARAKNAKTTVETYDAIRFALASLQDHHSALVLTPALQKVEAQHNPNHTAPKKDANAPA